MLHCKNPLLNVHFKDALTHVDLVIKLTIGELIDGLEGPSKDEECVAWWKIVVHCEDSFRVLGQKRGVPVGVFQEAESLGKLNEDDLGLLDPFGDETHVLCFNHELNVLSQLGKVCHDLNGKRQVTLRISTAIGDALAFWPEHLYERL